MSGIRVLRTFRVLRPLKAITFMPGLAVFVEAIIVSSGITMLNFMLLLLVMCALATLSYSFVGTALNQRCVPTPDALLNATSAIYQDPYFEEFGIDYFYSKYNLRFCSLDE